MCVSITVFLYNPIRDIYVIESQEPFGDQQPTKKIIMWNQTSAHDTLRPDKLARSARLGPVRIAVSSADTALSVWRELLGLAVISQADDLISLGVAGEVLVELETGAQALAPARTCGLYHLAIHVPTRRDFALVIARLSQAGYQHAPTDHLVTETTYLWDRDGNGIEIAFETPWRGKFNPDFEEGFARGALAIDAEGQPHSGREAIDLHALLTELVAEANLSEPLPVGSRIGHVHLTVSNLVQTMAFYCDVLGFEPQLNSEKIGIADLLSYYPPHILAFNTWQGTGIPKAPAGRVGLRFLTIEVPAEDLRLVARRLELAGVAASVDGGRVVTRDPDGNQIRFIAKQQLG